MADYYTLLTDAGIAYETACKAAGVPIKLAQISVGDGNGAVYNPDASAKALKREVWRGPLNALFQDEKNANWLMAEVTIPSDVGGWYVREAGLWTDTGILYAIVKYPESYKPVLATSGSGKEFYIRSIFETSNAAIVTLLIDDTVVKATRAWVMDYLSKGTYSKAEIEAMIAKASALPVGSMVAFPVDNIPPGFLEIDGSVKSVAAYPDLAKFLAGAFNKGDEGAGSFRLPESRGEFLRGWDHGREVDTGRAIGSYQIDAIQNIVGNLAADPAAAYQFLGEGNLNATGAFGVTSRTAPGISDATSVQMGASLSFDASRAVRTSSETRSRNLAVMWCIKAWNAPINQGNIDIAALASDLAVAMPRHYLGGFLLSLNSTAPNTTIDVSPGSARAAGNAVVLSTTLSGVLQGSGVWSVGNGGNKLDISVRNPNTWYHVFVIRQIVGGAADLLFSASLTSPVIPTGFELIRRIGSFKTDAEGPIVPFVMDLFSAGRRAFRFVNPIRDAIDADVTTTARAIALTVPPGITVEASVSTWIYTNNILAYFSPLDTADLAFGANSSAGYLTGYVSGYGSITDASIDSMGFKLEVRTDVNGQIRGRANIAGKFSMLTLGWSE